MYTVCAIVQITALQGSTRRTSRASFHGTAGSIQAQSYELAPRTRSTTHINITFIIPFVLTLFILFLSHYRHSLKSPVCKRELALHVGAVDLALFVLPVRSIHARIPPE